MNRKAIVTKTAKGMREATGATRFLSRDLRTLLKAVDGKSTPDDLAERLGHLTEPGFEQTLERLAAEGYIQEALLSSVGANDVWDLDFTGGGASTDAQRKSEETARRWAAERAKRRTEERERREAEKRAEREAAQRAAKEEQERTQAAVRQIAEARAAATERLRREAEAQAKRVEEEARRTAEAERKAAEERARREAEDLARREAEAQAKRKAEEEVRRTAEASRKAAEEKARREAEDLARREAEAQAKREAEEEARRAAEAARKAAEEKARREAEELARREAEAHAKRKAEEKARRAAEAARKAAEEKARREAEELARREAEAQAKREAEEEARRAAEAVRKAAEEKARREAERVRLEREAQAKREADERARRAAEAREAKKALERARRVAMEAARQAAEEQIRRKAAERAARKAEERARREAEQQARRQAEEQAKQEAEERARREAEELARREAEEQAQREAEEQARQEEVAERARVAAAEREKAAAAERARIEAAERAAMEAAARSSVEADVRGESRSLNVAVDRIADRDRGMERGADRAVDRGMGHGLERGAGHCGLQIGRNALKTADTAASATRARPARRGGMLAVCAFALLAGCVAVLHLVSFDGQRARFEKTAAAQFGLRVHIGAVHLSLLPRPQWRLDGLSIGNDRQIHARHARLPIEPGALLRDDAVFTSIELDAPVVTAEGLGWLLLGRAHERGFGVSRIAAHGAVLQVKGVSLPSLDATAELDANGNWRKMQVNVAGTDVALDLAPADDAVKYSLQSKLFAPPFIAGLPPLGGFSAEGMADRDGLRVMQFEGRLHGGVIGGSARLRFADMILAGEAHARRVDMAKLLPGLFEDGQLDGAASFALPVHDAGKAAPAPQLAGSFTVQRGVLAGIDMGSVLKGTGRAGRTRFARLDGTIAVENGRAQLRQLQLDAGAMTARGSVAIDPQLRGRIDVDLGMAGIRRRAALELSGAFAEPYLDNVVWTRR